MLKTFSLAAKMLRRQLRAGEWYIVIFSLLLAVSAVTALHFYVDRLSRGIEQQSARLLGGDLVVSSATPIPSGWHEKAKALGLKSAEVWSYPSVITTQNKMQLANIQAVSSSYPILNQDFIRPAEQQAWADPRLLQAMSLKLGDTIKIGAASFQLSRNLSSDVDTLNTGWSIAPLVMISLSDVPATKTVIPGSRVDYRMLLAGSSMAIKSFSDWITPQLTPSQRLLDVHNQQFALRDTLTKTDQYLQLIILVVLTMSGVAIALSIQQYLRRHVSTVALWRCLGAMQRQITRIFMWQLIMIAVFAGTVGVVVGYFAQLFFVELFAAYIRILLPPAGMTPVMLGFIVSSFLCIAFAYPVITQLPRVSPLLIWRDELADNVTGGVSYVVATIGLVLLLIWLMGYSLLILFFCGALVVSVALLYALHLALIAGLRNINQHMNGSIRRGLSQLIQFSDVAGLQFIGFTVIIMSLLVLNTVKYDLLAQWQQSLPADTPNYFAFNIAPSDLPAIKSYFASNQINIDDVYPMVRGRLIALNDKPILEAVPETARGHNALHRELNLSWMWEYPRDNKIVSGAAWSSTEGRQDVVSVEKNVATELGFRLGDKLTFQIGDYRFTTVVGNIRSVDWTSFHPNFFMIFKPGLLNVEMATFITSFYLPPNKVYLANQLTEQFPNVTVLDVANVLQQIQDLVGKISIAMQYLFLFALAAGGLIFIASVQASMDERRYTYRLLRTLGASKGYIAKSLIVEFSCLGAMVVVVSVVLAKVIGWGLLRYIILL